MNITAKAALASALAVTLSAGVAAGASAYQGEKYAAQAKVSVAAARAKAIGLVPGTIASEELEPEKGGSGLRYTFDIKTPRGVREVRIDAKTGAVLENIAEQPGADKKSGSKDNDTETND